MKSKNVTIIQKKSVKKGISSPEHITVARNISFSKNRKYPQNSSVIWVN